LALVGGAAGDARADGPFAPVGQIDCYKWYRGFYAGAHVGSGVLTSHQNDLDGYLAGNAGYTGSGWGPIGGAQIGYNLQSSHCRALLGIEADWSGSRLDANTRLNTHVAIAGFDQSIASRLDSFGTVRTRVGYVIDNALIYLTSGIAIAGVETQIANFNGVIAERFKLSDTRVGWTAGAGTEWGLAPSISLKSEVLYLGLGGHSAGIASPTLGNFFSFKTEESAWIARVGLNVRLGP
jgi:outer membrane immunogenic protein